MDKQSNKSHRATKDGRGSKSAKAASLASKKGTQNARHNPRAFSVANVVRTKRTAQRNLDRSQKKEVVPLDDRRPGASASASASGSFDEPPAVVCVAGPRGCGKSVLLRSLVKLYAQHNLTGTRGTITLRNVKRRRVTFLEVPPDDVPAALDAAKVADLVLLVVDARAGFEMDTFEFLNMLQSAGMPKVLTVLTHLDLYKTMKGMRDAVKRMKHRLWTELHDGAKVYSMNGTVRGRYLKNDVRTLRMAIDRTKYRPLVWRNAHPYVLVDRVEDLTPEEEKGAPGGTRDVALYG
eukprot:CAMPEP_0194267306 /NCGR_PEP_ID=MMETSP0169-20130528/1866_1 /TAXON_ID=218684 /ORGANISM="Corethron pennatum, Strain L29A3" /LENGTH=292 /DNA_ID=CAMNT_0039008127 /DNA_START=164 /DNA_END=1039 /DNA_ORIENTATION=+